MKHTFPSVDYDQVDPNLLKPHPRNYQIYGENEDVSELVKLISESRWVKRLVVTPCGTIISGHRRWKAALFLGLETVAVEVKQFPDQTAELEALLLENVSRFKTIEQKVREANAWKDVEAHKARLRQLSSLKQGSASPVQANLPEREKGQTRDLITQRVGLRARNYEKAARVVEIIDEQTALGNSSYAQVLRQVLNEQSVDAAHQIVKKPTEEQAKILAVLASNQAQTTKEAFALLQQQSRECQGEHEEMPHTFGVSPSCWNCQNRGELIANHGFYCNRLGALSLLDKSADVRGAECDLWSYRWGGPLETRNSPQPTHETFTLTLPAYLQLLLQDAARTTGMSLVDWAITVLESKALALCNDKSVTQPTSRPEMQVAQCRSL